MKAHGPSLLKLFSLFFCVCMQQCLAVFTPLIVILVFSVLKKSEHEDWKEATLGNNEGTNASIHFAHHIRKTGCSMT